jgi:DNA-binding CsgD family transcriptional regulator
MGSAITGGMPAHRTWMRMPHHGRPLPSSVTVAEPCNISPKKRRGTVILLVEDVSIDSWPPAFSAFPPPDSVHESDGLKEELEKPRQVLLTDRQLEAARLLVTGLSNKEIGAQMGISERAAKTHLEAIGRKARIRGRVKIALWYERQSFPKS